MEAALKVARQYFLELPTPQPLRTAFIARLPSYHGATLSTLSIGGHVARREPFVPLLSVKVGQVSPCNEYRGLGEGESTDEYVGRLAAELDHEFERMGPGSVCAFVGETITGASTGCVVPAKGYWAAIQAVCRKHGALLILDEVMCGMGRTGTLHAWEQEHTVPNILVVGKGLGAGYVPISGLPIDAKITYALQRGSGRLSHGQSFQAHPVACAAALAVQKFIMQEGLLENVNLMGTRLGKALRTRLGHHPYVGNIRGRGLFWAVEFVQDKRTKDPFPPARNVGYSICEMAARPPHNLSVYPGRGSVDGVTGDHVLLAPAFVVTADQIDCIVNVLTEVVFRFFHTAHV